MFDTSENGLKQIISKGESQTVEFKRRLPPDNILARIFVAFANTSGGIIFIGIDDDGKIIGLMKKEARFALDRLKRLSVNLLNSRFETAITNLNGQIVVYAIVNKAPEILLPVRTSTGDIYERSGISTIKSIEKNVNLLSIPGEEIKGFVAMSFREEEEPALIDYFEAMKRAVKEAKFPINLTRIDLLDGDYEISQKIMDEIFDSDFILADFTLNPKNVYFEVGIARGCGKVVIQTALFGTDLEFDVRNWRTLFYKNATELEKKLISSIPDVYNEVIEKKDKM